MPLMSGKSNKAFEHNIKVEREAGKPMNQSLAIAYAQKRKRMSKGGAVREDDKMMADGGEVLHNDDEMLPGDHDPVARIMAKRAKEEASQADIPANVSGSYSEGGEVANEDDRVVDEESAEYDDLPLDDDLSFSYTGDNSGDMDGDTKELDMDDDIISRIMRMRKQHNPRPA